MGWCRRSSRLISDAFRCYNPKIVLQPRRNPIVSRRFFSSSIIPNSSKIYEFPSPCKNPYRHVAKRSYYRSSYNEEPDNVPIAALVLIGVWIIVPNLETVPYTKRTQFVLSSSSQKKDEGETQFKKLKTEYEGKILPPLDPYSIRAQRIANDIIDGLKKGLQKEQMLNEEKQGKEKQGNEKQGMKSHIDGLNWEIIVVNDPMRRAFCARGGKIFVSTGLLDLFTEDAEVATIIGHEVGHAVARHSAEEASETGCRWMEIEADYIGLMLMASAGYDPRVAPQVFEKFIKIVGDSELNNYISRHPSSKKRIELLGETKVMEEALNIYREVQAERGLQANFL